MPPSVTDLPQVETTPTAPVQAEHVAQMMDDLFTAMLGMPFNPVPEGVMPQGCDDLQASVRVSGDWNAEIRILASAELSRQIACAMFAAEPADLTSDEILDALGEVANVIGGNAKGIVGRDCRLSLPCVGAPAPECGADRLSLTFQCGEHPISVQLIDR